MNKVPTAPLAMLLVMLLALPACSGSDDNPGRMPGAQGSADAGGAAPDPAECELGVSEIKAKLPDTTPRPSEGGPTDSCAWQGKSRARQPLLVTVFGDPSEEFTTMDEAKAKKDVGGKTYRQVPELAPKAWLEHGVYATVHWPTKHLIVQVSSETLTEDDVISIAKAVNNDLTKLGA